MLYVIGKKEDIKNYSKGLQKPLFWRKTALNMGSTLLTLLDQRSYPSDCRKKCLYQISRESVNNYDL